MKRLLDIQKNTQNILKYKQKVNTQRSSQEKTKLKTRNAVMTSVSDE